MNPTRYTARQLPESLRGLADLAMDLRWSWNHAADDLWESVDPELWKATGNAWLILESVSVRRLEELTADQGFLEALNAQVARREAYLLRETWFERGCGRHAPLPAVAYFSMEFGLSEALPIYSGGLGMLAGDHLKTASDLGVPVIGVGLLYQQGYFRQAVDACGQQLAFYPYNDPTMLPAMPVRDDDGEWVHVEIGLPGRTLRLRTWQVKVGRVTLFLLDSNDPRNSPGDRGITSELYGGGSELRLQQEIVLGIGGWRLLQSLGADVPVCHLNEGHAAFAVLERARSFMHEHSVPFEVAVACCRAGNIFTTHTPVEAGFDRFAPDLFAQYFSRFGADIGLTMEQLLAMGRLGDDGPGQPFNMAYLALRGCARTNGVSRLHGRVSRHIFQPLFPRWPVAEVPVGHVTNGVHVPSWDSSSADALWTDACGKERWRGDLESVEQELKSISPEALWAARGHSRAELVYAVRQRLQRQGASRAESAAGVAALADVLDPNCLTIGFARRFAEYKRPNLLLQDPERLTRLLNHGERPVQLIIAGKAHPADAVGKDMVSQWHHYIARPEVRGRVVFLEDYDMALAAELVQGVDLWLNTPRRPWEACGTSGMKVLVNGGLNLSELDGWWAEAYEPDLGWALGDGFEHPDVQVWDHAEAQALYALLEREVVPEFYDRDATGIPQRWVARVRESMARLTPRFSANRMVREYTEDYYLPAAEDFVRRWADDGRLGWELNRWSEAVYRHGERLHFGHLQVDSDDQGHRFQIPVYLDDLEPDSVRVELYAESARDGQAPLRIVMERGAALAGAVNSYLFTAQVDAERPPGDYTPRIVPHHPQARVPLENTFILWYR